MGYRSDIRRCPRLGRSKWKAAVSDCRASAARHSRRYDLKLKDIRLHPEVAHAGHTGGSEEPHHALTSSLASRTPRPWTFFAQGRSPGLRIITFIPAFPGLHDPVTRNGTDARRLQLRGQLRHCPALQRVSPNSRLSPRSLRIARTSNTRYSTRVKISVNNLFANSTEESGEIRRTW